MNRAERRRLNIKNKEPVFTLRTCDIENIKHNATNLAFFLMLAIPTMVIHDKFSKLMKRDGREQTFADEVIKLYEAFNEGYVSLEELHECLKTETGLTITLK